MESDSFDLSLPLKTGRTVNVRLALLERARLERLLRVHPIHFQALLDLCGIKSRVAYDNDHNITEQSISFLQQQGSMLNDRTVRTMTRDILLSGFQMTPDGPTIVYPFVTSSTEEAAAVEDIQKRLLRSFVDNWKRGTNPKDSNPPVR